MKLCVRCGTRDSRLNPRECFSTLDTMLSMLLLHGHFLLPCCLRCAAWTGEWAIFVLVGSSDGCYDPSCCLLLCKIIFVLRYTRLVLAYWVKTSTFWGSKGWQMACKSNDVFCQGPQGGGHHFLETRCTFQGAILPLLFALLLFCFAVQRTRGHFLQVRETLSATAMSICVCGIYHWVIKY